MRSDEERIWKVRGEDRVIHDGWLKIYPRTYVLPDGRVAEWDLPGGAAAVAVLALTPDERLVMVRQSRPGPDRVVLTLPGGLIDPGETPVQAGGGSSVRRLGTRMRPSSWWCPRSAAPPRTTGTS